MEQKFLEIFELKYKKIINSSQIMYKTLASYNEMAFSQKKMLKNLDCYIQALILNSLIKSNELNLEIIKQLNDICDYEFLLKKIKLRKVNEIDDKLIDQIKNICFETINSDPLFIKVSAYFDSITAKLENVEKISGCKIIEECLLTMLLLVRNINEVEENKTQYKKDIEIIYKYIKR